VVVLKRSFSNTALISDLIGRPEARSYDIDQVRLDRVFVECDVDIILHCATNYGRRDNNPIEIIEANLMLPLRLLLLAAEHGVGCFVNTDTLLDKRVNSYSLSKKHFLDWLKVYKDRMRCINVALEHFYGFGDDNSKFVTQVVQEIVSGAREVRLTKGEQKRDFIYIDDVIDAFVCILHSLDATDRGFTEFQIGSGKAVAIRDLCETIKRLAGNTRTQLNFGAIPYRENEIMESVVDLSRLTELGWSPKMSLKEGLARIIRLEAESMAGRRAPSECQNAKLRS